MNNRIQASSTDSRSISTHHDDNNDNDNSNFYFTGRVTYADYRIRCGTRVHCGITNPRRSSYSRIVERCTTRQKSSFAFRPCIYIREEEDPDASQLSQQQYYDHIIWITSNTQTAKTIPLDIAKRTETDGQEVVHQQQNVSIVVAMDNDEIDNWDYSKLRNNKSNYPLPPSLVVTHSIPPVFYYDSNDAIDSVAALVWNRCRLSFHQQYPAFPPFLLSTFDN